MNVLKEIEDHADEADKPVLRGLFKRYHMESQWRFVANMRWKPTDMNYSVSVVRVWFPTEEGRVLWKHLIQPAEQKEGRSTNADSEADTLPFVRVTPTIRGSFDSTTYPWDQLDDAFADVEATLDMTDGKEVKVVTVFMTQAEFDALPKEDEI
jgi:hypothetical protein